MTEGEKEKIAKCIFCGKELEKSEIVRYKGALSCRSCAESQEPVHDLREGPLFKLAGIGSLIGLFVVMYAMVHLLRFVPLYAEDYVPPLEIYFTGMIICVGLQSLGFFALNKTYNQAAAIIVSVLGILTVITYTYGLLDIVGNGYYYVVDEFTFVKSYTYYPAIYTTYSLFTLAAGLAVLLFVSNTRTENISMLCAVLYLVIGSVGAFGYISPPVGFIHILLYAAAFGFFVTRKEILEEEPVKTIDYH